MHASMVRLIDGSTEAFDIHGRPFHRLQRVLVFCPDYRQRLRFRPELIGQSRTGLVSAFAPLLLGVPSSRFTATAGTGDDDRSWSGDAYWLIGSYRSLPCVAPYTHRVAISNHRILDIAQGKVTFRYKDYRHEAQQKTMILAAEEFIRRFLLHVLPDGFQRIRYYGFLGNRYREQKLAHCRELLGMPTPKPSALETAEDYRERYEELTGSSLWQCPVCRQGRMLVTQILPRRPPRQVSIKDTS
jgi:Putative transposase